MTTGRIVVGVDGSPASVDALRWAARQAELTGFTLDAVTSWEYPLHFGNEFYREGIDWADNAQQSLDTALKEAGDGTPIAGGQRVTEGPPARVLVAASSGADLMVVGSRGHGGFTGLLLGSVSEYVIAHAHCPVLVVRHHHPAPADLSETEVAIAS